MKQIFLKSQLLSNIKYFDKIIKKKSWIIKLNKINIIVTNVNGIFDK